MRYQRIDDGKLGSVQRTPSGGIRIPANIGRTGVQIYLDANGTERREYRPADEVFKADSLASLASAAVTRLHPPELVTAENWQRFAVGQTSDREPSRERIDANDFIRADLVINHGPVIGEIDAGKLAELSAGYTCELEMNPGVTPAGERYDAIQRNISYNHVALGPPGFARAGREARLRTDGHQHCGAEIMKVTIDGVEYEKGSDAHISALENAAGKEKARADKAEKELGEAKVKLDQSQKDIARLRAEGEGEGFAKRMDQELAFRSDAAKLLPKDYKFDGKTRRVVMTDALKEAGVKLEINEDTKDAFIEGAFNAAVAGAGERTDYNGLSDDGKRPLPKVDGAESHEDFIKRLDADAAKAAAKWSK